jgi:hypothetical protein
MSNVAPRSRQTDTRPTLASAGPTPRAGLVLVIMCAGMFLVLLDVTVVNVAVPSIASGRGPRRRGCSGWSPATQSRWRACC